VIVVLGRPGLSADGGLNQPAGQIALAAAGAGGRVEVVGSVGDDADGDEVVVQLGRGGIGHAALLRDPAGVTPRAGTDAGEERGDRLPRLDAGDVDLGLRYLAEIGVLVVAEPIPDDALHVAADAAAYHGAALVVLTPAGPATGHASTLDLADDATVLEEPTEGSAAFAQLVAAYAVALDNGRSAADAWRDAVEQTGWEPATE
jgi:sugar/nucleoside kinase (ribokinase family)